MITKYAAFVTLLIFSLSANGQIKLDGPKEAKVGKVVKIKAVELKGLDPKVICVPQNENWMAVKSLDGELAILLFPEKSGIYTIFIATNEASKTHTAFHSVNFNGSVPPSPPDVPIPTELYQKLEAAYKVSPDAENLSKLIKVYEEFRSENETNGFKNYAEANLILANTASAFLNDQDLRKVRDEVAVYLQKQVGTNAKLYSKPVLTKAMDEIIKVLKAIQTGK